MVCNSAKSTNDAHETFVGAAAMVHGFAVMNSVSMIHTDFSFRAEHGAKSPLSS